MPLVFGPPTGPEPGGEEGEGQSSSVPVPGKVLSRGRFRGTDSGHHSGMWFLICPHFVLLLSSICYFWCLCFLLVFLLVLFLFFTCFVLALSWFCPCFVFMFRVVAIVLGLPCLSLGERLSLVRTNVPSNFFEVFIFLEIKHRFSAFHLTSLVHTSYMYTYTYMPTHIHTPTHAYGLLHPETGQLVVQTIMLFTLS